MFPLSLQVAGVIYRLNFFQVQQWLKLPDSLTSTVSRTVGNMFASDNPPAQPYAMGATLEIQRLQQIEHYEQQAMRARMGHLRNRVRNTVVKYSCQRAFAVTDSKTKPFTVIHCLNGN